MIGIIITGLPATGKTYYTDWLNKELSKRGKVYHIYGDAIAHCSYDCQYTKKELDIKYNVIDYLITQAIDYQYPYVVIDDFYKRKKDYRRVSSRFERLIVIGLQANMKDLIIRNNKRPRYHRLTEEKMLAYKNMYGDILSQEDIDYIIDVSLNSRQIVKNIIMRIIDENDY